MGKIGYLRKNGEIEETGASERISSNGDDGPIGENWANMENEEIGLNEGAFGKCRATWEKGANWRNGLMI